MAGETPGWVQNVIDDGRAPVEGDPDDPVLGQIEAVEAGPPRRKKVGDVIRGEKLVPVYEYVAPEVALVFNPSTGKMEYVNGGSLDELSGQRVHRDEQRPLPLGTVSDALDVADIANNQADVITRRPRIKAGRTFKTIGR